MHRLPRLLALVGCCLAAFLGATPVAQADAESVKEERSAGSEDDDSDPMNWLGLSLKVGYSHQNASDISNPVYNKTVAQEAAKLSQATLESYGLAGGRGCGIIDKRCRTASRNGLQLALTLHLGGDGMGWDVEPYLMLADSATAVGVYLGPKFDLHLADPLYFGFGFGFKAAYVAADGWQRGADLGGRIPVHLTFYVRPNFALTAEGSFGAGVSGYTGKARRVTNPANPDQTIGTVPEMSFGAARVWDLTLGVRFP